MQVVEKPLDLVNLCSESVFHEISVKAVESKLW